MILLRTIRESAKAAGLMHFDPDRPCRKGHRAKRYVSTGACLQCSADRAREWGIKNREKTNARMRRHRAINPESARAACRKWHHANPEIWHKAHAERRQLNPEAERTKWRQWAKENPAARKAIANNRRTRKLKAEGKFSAGDVARIRKQQRERCAYCRESFGADSVHLDHIQPLAAGGTNWPRNLQLLCQSCNAKKWMLDPIVYAQRLGMLL